MRLLANWPTISSDKVSETPCEFNVDVFLKDVWKGEESKGDKNENYKYNEKLGFICMALFVKMHGSILWVMWISWFSWVSWLSWIN